MNFTKNIPNTITLLNLVSGVFGIICAMQEQFVCAFLLMIAAAVFDLLDGMAARGLKAYSELGKQLDSLADAVSFGVLPAIMLFWKMHHIFVGPEFLTLIPVLIAPCAILRLAKFNIDETQAHGFKGLPTPAAALFAGSLAATMSILETSWLTGFVAKSFIVMPVITYILCRMMLSRVDMASIKNLGSKSDSVFNSKALLALLLLVPVIAGIAVAIYFAGEGLAAAIATGVLAFSALYIVFNSIAGIIIRFKK